ncbi:MULTISPECIES: hypothetical protein [Halococcus]|uniref:Uncharacterized protein n=1 Tax=Halococcus salifodinae DSM 8989 TaxID=1227456 RepID=M0N9J4_9EURY|nr:MULTISPECIES: hypothetical protein [Halococcus]EMA53325.1 hypothetical protein C450_08422 [Halococcus salifodinae DSM 8989]
MAESIRRTLRTLRIVASRWDARAILTLTGLAYLIGYSFAVGDLALTGRGGISLLVVDAPLDRAFQSTGYLSFEPIAAVEAGPLTYLFSPIDAGLALVLAALVGINVALTYLGLVQPRACGMESSVGLLAAVPALFSGAACCGPVVLIAIGVQATGAVIAGFQLLLPIAVGLLALSVVLVGRRIDPTLA